MTFSSPLFRSTSGPRSRQRGRARSAALFVWLLLVSALILGGWWWWWQGRGETARVAADRPGGAATPAASAPASAASAAATRGQPGSGSRAYYADRPQPVSIGRVERQDLREIVNAIGTITAFNTVVVRTQVAGPLTKIRFQEGQEVKAGQLLAEIDPRPLQAALAQAQGQLAKDQAQLKNAQIDAKRYRDLLAKDSIARQQVDTQDALVRQLQGTLAVNQAAVDSAKLQLSYTKITAPIGGRLGLRQVDVGNNVAPSDAGGIVSITQTRPINVTFAVPEAKLPQLARQLGGRGTAGEPLPVEAWNREQTIRLASGHVTATDNAVDAATGTIKVKARFANADNLLFPNQFVNVRLQIALQGDVLTVPTNAVQRGSIGTYVYRVGDDNAVTVRRIETGVVDGDRVGVHGELASGDQVVTDGADRLREGAKVVPIVPGADGAAAAVPAAAPTAIADGRPAWMDRLPPETVEKVRLMKPAERQAYLKKLQGSRAVQPPAPAGS